MAADIHTDIAVIGAGPAGLYGAYYAGFRNATITIVDSLDQPGGQVSALYPAKRIYDVAGFPSIRGQELVDRLVEQAEAFDPSWLLGERAEELITAPEQVTLVTDRGSRIEAGAVIITGGIGTFAPRPLPVGGEFEGRGLMYFVPRPDELTGKRVLIVGGGDSAFDWAQTLKPIAQEVTLVHRRSSFRAHERTVADVSTSGIEILTDSEIVACHPKDSNSDVPALGTVEIEDRDNGMHRSLEVDVIVAALGFRASLGPLKRWGLAHDGRKLVVDTTMATSLGRVFAAGDITTYPGKVDLISVGFGEAATAVNNAMPKVNPDARVFPGHSTHS